MTSVANTTQLSTHCTYRLSSINSAKTRKTHNLINLKQQSFLPQASILRFSTSRHDFPNEFPINASKISSLTPTLKRKREHKFVGLVALAADSDSDDHDIDLNNGVVESSKSFFERFPVLVTGFFFFMWLVP
ncbi:hypothetical protein RND81_11G048000 [Saponaria officinalis]|uniref:Uncharacterized protein n=1 Tax=Saponaria officinalis TaxID=3572 RepID=A0AAW1HHZ2_SAPOF